MITRTLVGQVPAIEITEIDMTLVWCGLTVSANQNQDHLNIVTRSIVLQPIKSFVFHKYRFHVLKDSVEFPFQALNNNTTLCQQFTFVYAEVGRTVPPFFLPSER